MIQGSFLKTKVWKSWKKSVKIWPPKNKKLWHHQDIAYVSKYYIVLLIYSCFQLCCLDTCKIVMPLSSETFYICAYLKSITTYLIFCQQEKIIRVRESQLSLYMRGRCLLTSIFKIYIKFLFCWYVVCLVPKMSNNFDLSHGL